MSSFSHGIRYIPPDSRERIQALSPGEPLYLMRDIQNPFDDDALLMRTGDPISCVGYCPRFYAAEFTEILDRVNKDRGAGDRGRGESGRAPPAPITLPSDRALAR